METYKKTTKESYNILKEVPLYIRRNYAKTILSFTKQNQSILDAGFGSGSILIPLVEKNKFAKIYGIDYSKPLFNSVSKEIRNKAKLHFGNILNLRETYDVVHFKAILHCFDNPEKALDKLASLVKLNGLIITAHEKSQIEDRIEQISFNKIDDKELELMIGHYFVLRKNIGKPFILRKYPAGNCLNAIEYLKTKKNFRIIKKIKNKKLSWNREFKLADLIYSIKNRTYKVFDDDITEKENKFIVDNMLKFAKIHSIDLNKKRCIPANFEMYILKKMN